MKNLMIATVLGAMAFGLAGCKLPAPAEKTAEPATAPAAPVAAPETAK